MWTDRRSGGSSNRHQDHRDPYEKDRTRVIHCAAFRRLQRKTQILGTETGDFHRTRLTHSLEVSSIGRSIVRNLLARYADSAQISSYFLHEDLISAICLLHDIGHPPFGHSGEVALNYKMHPYGGFESNGQTLRLLTKTENSYGEYGLDLTRRTLLGILKYPVNRSKVIARNLLKPFTSFDSEKKIRINDWLPPKSYLESEEAEVEWLLHPFESGERLLFQSLSHMPQFTEHGRSAFHSLDCSIMDVADNIAYGVHDLEDAIHLKLIQPEDLITPDFLELISETELSKSKNQLLKFLFSEAIEERKEAIGNLVNFFITSTQLIPRSKEFKNPLLQANLTLAPGAKAFLEYLIHFIYKKVIDSHSARVLEFGAQRVILGIFEALESDPLSLLDLKHRELFREAADEINAYRVICDYIANMSDEFAYRFHEQLFGFQNRTFLSHHF